MNSDNWYVAEKFLPDGRWACVTVLTFSRGRINVGRSKEIPFFDISY